MSVYHVVVSKSAEKELYDLPNVFIPKIISAIKSLEKNPRPAGCKKLKGFRDLWRIIVNNYRIIYSIDDTIKIVDIRKIGDRKNIYE